MLVGDEVRRLRVVRRVEDRLDVTAVAQHELAVPAQQLRGAVCAVPRDDVVGVAGDDEAVARDLAEVDRGAEHVERALDEPVGQVQVEEVGVQPGRQPCGVVVPVEDVEGGWVLAQQVVVDPVVPHEVVGAQPGEDPGHVVAGEDAGPHRPCPRRLDGSSRGEGGDRGLGPRVEPGDEERRRVHELRRAGGGEVAEHRGQCDASGADAHGVGVVGPGDVAGDVDGLEDCGGVGVEVPVALLGRRVAPAEREVGDAGGDRALDEAAAGRQIGDVVLVDLRRDDHERSLVDPPSGLLVLDQLEHLGAVHDRDRG